MWAVHVRKTTCVLTLFYCLQQITLILLHINLHLPEVCRHKRGGGERERGGRQIEGEHTQFKSGQFMQEKQLVCSHSSVTFPYKPFQYINMTNWSCCTKITHLPTLPKALWLFITWKERNLDLIVYRNDAFYDFIYRWWKRYRETLTKYMWFKPL